MSFKSYIYNRENTEEDKSSDWPLTILFLLFILLGYLLLEMNSTLAIISLVIGFLGSYINLYKGFWGTKEKSGDYVGQLVLSDEEFIINNESIKTSDISNLKIEIGHHKGKKIWTRYDYTISSGNTNSLEITVKGKVTKLNFQIFSPSELKDLKSVLESLYKQRLFINEYYLGNRTYLLEDLDYEEIQEFKSKYKLR